MKIIIENCFNRGIDLTKVFAAEVLKNSFGATECINYYHMENGVLVEKPFPAAGTYSHEAVPPLLAMDDAMAEELLLALGNTLVAKGYRAKDGYQDGLLERHKDEGAWMRGLIEGMVKK